MPMSFMAEKFHYGAAVLLLMTSCMKMSLSDVEIVEVELDGCAVQPAETEVSTTCTADIKQTEAGVSPPPLAAGSSQRSRTVDSSGATSSALQLNKPSGLSLEDPVKMMDSILNENGAISQNINLLGK